MGYNALLREKRVIRPNYGNSKAGFRPYGTGSWADGAGSGVGGAGSRVDAQIRGRVAQVQQWMAQVSF